MTICWTTTTPPARNAGATSAVDPSRPAAARMCSSSGSTSNRMRSGCSSTSSSSWMKWLPVIRKTPATVLLAILIFGAVAGHSQALKFKTEPADVRVPSGHSVLLPCSGSLSAGAHQRAKQQQKLGAASQTTIKWRGPDGQDIGIVDTFRAQFPNGSLYISSLEDQRGLTGSYQCVLHAEGVGTIVSRAARVTIAKLPELNSESSELYVLAGQTAYFKCFSSATTQAEHGLAYKVQWFKDEVALVVDESRMTVFASGALEIDAVRQMDAGTYQCQVTAGVEFKTSSKANLNLKPEPVADESGTVATAAPVAPHFLSATAATLRVREGSAATLECTANGQPQPQTKWLRNGVDIDVSDLDSRYRLLGTGSLHVALVDESDAGSYQCRASNSADTVFALITLEVQVPPRLIDAPHDRVALEKEELELVCAMRGRPTPVVQWLKNGDVIRPNDYMQVVNGHNLRILGLIDSDAGMFQCVGVNPAGSVQAAARLQISKPAAKGAKKSNRKAASVVTVQPPQQRSKSPRQKPPPPPPSSSAASAGPQVVVLVEPSSPPQRTTIKTLSKNVFESLHGKKQPRGRRPQPLPVIVPQTLPITEYLDDAIEDDGDLDADLDAEDEEDDDNDGDDDEEYEYGAGPALEDFDNDNEDDGGGTIHPFGPHIDPKVLLNTLTQANAKHSDDGGAGFEQGSKRKFLSTASAADAGLLAAGGGEMPRPGAPRDLVAQIVNPRFVALSWLEPATHPDEVSSYTVFYKIATSERERKITTKTRDVQLVNIQALLPGRTYQFRVVANSAGGAGNSSAIYEVSTQPEENISGPPLDVVGEAVSDSAIRVQWKQPLVTNGNISKYRIYYTELEGTDMYTDSQTLEALLTELRPYTEYTVSVVPFNAIGMGDPSNELIVQTFTAVPRETPINVTVETSSSTSLIVRWEPPPKEDQNGPITGYKIRYRKTKSPVQVETTPGNSRHLELTGLEKMAAYQVKIAAMTVNGTGPFTDWSLVETLENDLIETQVPGEPAFLRTKAKANSIVVSWGAPTDQPEIKVRSYILSWGLGIPDVDRRTLDENTRFYEITDLDPNSEYVISLRVHNRIGDGKPRYENVRTRDEDPADAYATLEVPVGLRAITMSASSIVVYWTDTTLNRNQQVVDNRHYTVRYNVAGTTRFRYQNTTDLNYMLGDLRSNSQYEFAVKVVKGRRESAWSMSVLNATAAAVELPAPRELTVFEDSRTARNQASVTVAWQPVNLAGSIGSPINGYLVYYTTDTTQRDRDWDVVTVPGGDSSTVRIANLKPATRYYFKAQLRTVRNSYGPFSQMAQHLTAPAGLPGAGTLAGGASGSLSANGGAGQHSHGTLGGGVTKLSGEMLIYVVAAASALVILIAVVVLVVLCRKKPVATPEHAKQSYMKNTAAIKPPDLWIHHDQMELKNVGGGGGGGADGGPGGVLMGPGGGGAGATGTVGKQQGSGTPGYSDGASSSGAMTLPRSVNHGDFEHESASAAGGGSHVTNSLDKRSYVPGYMTTSMNSMERPAYPRTQYSSRVVPPHVVSCDPSAAATLSQQNLMQSGGSMNGQQTPELPYCYDSMPGNYSNPNVTYAPGLSVDAPKRGQGHPLKSFSVPGPPSTQQLLPNQPKHNVPAVTIRPQNASPYKKSGSGSAAAAAAGANRLQQSGPSVVHSNDEVQRLAPSTSTEELNQEMANLEGLMKDLSAITANEFEC